MNDIPQPNVNIENSDKEKQVPNTAATDAPPETAPAKPSGWTSFGLFNNLLTTVKKQSEIVVDVYRRDLSEFVQVVHNETKAGVRAAAQTVERNVEAVVGPFVEPGSGAAVETQKSDRGDDEISNQEEKTNEEVEQTEPAPGETTTVSKSPRTTKRGGGAASSLFRKVAARTTAAVHSFDTAAEAFENAAVSRAGELVHAATGKDPRELYDAATNGELVSKWGTQLGGLLSSAVAVVPPKEPVAPRKRIIYDRKEARLEELRMDPATYTTDPRTDMTDPTLPNRFEEFADGFRIPEQAGHISRLLAEKTEIKEILGRLVPSEIPYDVFWQRFFFRVEELEREEERRRTLVQNVVTNEAEEFSWDMEDEDSTENSPETVETAKDVSDPTLPEKTSDLDDTNPPAPPPVPTTTEADATAVPELSNQTEPSSSIEPEPSEKVNEPVEPFSKPVSHSPTLTSTSSSSPVILRSTDSVTSCASRTSEEGFELEAGAKKVVEEKLDPELPKPTPQAEEEDDWSDWE